VDVSFIDHLTVNELANEHRLYLNGLSPFSDSANYYKTKFHLKYFDDSLLLLHYGKSKILCDADTGFLAKTSAAFLVNSNRQKKQTWFNAMQQNPANTDLMELQNIYHASISPNAFTSESFPAQAQNAYSKYKKAYNKKPFLAGALSTAVPGLGKLYAGKTRSFIMTLILNAAYGAQTIESSVKLGNTHPLTIINAGAFTVFYLSNIYGSYQAVRQLRKEYKKQFLIDATRFYN